ncbi:MAG: tryptophan-rich sensory protein [Candidatus Methanomethylophilaceae archaeon]
MIPPPFLLRMDILSMLAPVFVCLASSLLLGMTTFTSAFYSTLNLPPISPLTVIPPMIWIAMLAFFAIILFKAQHDGDESKFFRVFWMLMVADFFWVPIFLISGNAILAMADVVMLWVSVLLTMIFVNDREGNILFILVLICLVALTYVTYVNLGAVIFN